VLAFGAGDFFTTGFAESFWSNVLAGALVAYVAYRFVESRLHLKRDREARAEVQRDVLQAIKGELEDNVSRAEPLADLVAREELPSVSPV